jgi:hypothetical protein
MKLGGCRLPQGFGELHSSFIITNNNPLRDDCLLSDASPFNEAERDGALLAEWLSNELRLMAAA